LATPIRTALMTTRVNRSGRLSVPAMQSLGKWKFAVFSYETRAEKSCSEIWLLVQAVHDNEVMRITKQPNVTAIIQSRRLSIFGHRPIARMDDDVDAKMILTAPSPNNWKRPPGRPRITWLNTVQRDLRAHNLTLNEAVDLAQNRPLCRLISTYGATHS